MCLWGRGCTAGASKSSNRNVYRHPSVKISTILMLTVGRFTRQTFKTEHGQEPGYVTIEFN